MLLVESLARAARTAPDKPAMVVGDRSISYRQLDSLSSSAAARLAADGIRAGDRVALHLTNGVDLAVAYYACFKHGAIALPINTRFKSGEIDYVLRHAAASAYVGQPDLAREIGAWPDDVRARYLHSELTAEREARHEPGAAVDDDAPAAVLYTSGTTAKPKGVTHTQRTLGATAAASRREFFASSDVVCNPLPMVHMAALMGLAAAVDGAITMVTAPVFDPDAFLDDFERHRGTSVLAMPVHYRALVDAQTRRRRDVRSARMFFVGGDSVPAALQEQFAQAFGRPLVEAYGLSEIVPVSTNPPDAIRTGSLGLPSHDIAVRIIDDERRDVRRGEVGEVAVRGPGTFVGYWNDPQATARAFQDGWFLTGDLASVDAEGYLWFAGRKKEIIVHGGSNVSPQEVEEAIYQHPAVAEAAVVGVPDERWGEIVVVGVVIRAGMSVTESDLVEFSRQRLSLYKCPERIVFLETMPKGPTGKVLRRAVRERIGTGT